jgi:undecaprenyl-phosphate 4-deoxy-4-formamido-L-arabinose transferase
MAPVDLSVVIPVFRSAATLRALVARLMLVLENTGLGFEVVFVEDGGGDDSWRVLCGLQDGYAGRIVAIQLMRNYGQHNALMCGFRHARGEVVVTMDDDLQNPPEEIPKLLATMQQGGFDLVYGHSASKKHNAWRNAGSSVMGKFHRLVLGSRVRFTPFRAIQRSLLTTIFPYDLNFTFVDGLLSWNTDRIGEVEVEHEPRAAGRSGYNPRKLIVLSLNLLTNFSLLPLQVVSAIGVVVSGAGFLLAIYYLAMALLSRIAVPGYASIIITVLIIGGTQLLALGIIGEYLGRLHLNVNRKPQYQVRTALGATGLDRSPTAAAVEPVEAGAQDPRSLARGTRVDLPHAFDGPGRAPSQSREPRA